MQSTFLIAKILASAAPSLSSETTPLRRKGLETLPCSSGSLSQEPQLLKDPQRVTRRKRKRKHIPTSWRFIYMVCRHSEPACIRQIVFLEEASDNQLTGMSILGKSLDLSQDSSAESLALSSPGRDGVCYKVIQGKQSCLRKEKKKFPMSLPCAVPYCTHSRGRSISR